MERILVTGATGFIGTHVINKLLLLGYEVIATASNIINAKKKDWFEKVVFIPLDFRKLNDVDYYEFFQRPDIVIHLAWEGLPNYTNEFHVNENLPRHKFFLHNLVKNGAKNINVAGTCLEYGMSEGLLNEEMYCNPTLSYAIAKYQLYQYLKQLKKDFTFSLKWIRFFYMYGEGQNTKSLFAQLENAIGNKEEHFNMSGGEQVRDFLPIETVVQNTIDISLQSLVEGIVNCASGKPERVIDFVLGYLRKKQSNIKLNLGFYPYTDYEPMYFWADIEKLKKVIRNDSKYSL